MPKTETSFKKTNQTFFFFLLIIVLTLFLVPSASALSNQSTEAEKNIEQAKSCFEQMLSRNISVQRANASLQEAIQLYSAQRALEAERISAKYDVVNKFSLEVCQIEEVAFKASDELDVFMNTFWNSDKESNLSAIYHDYDAIIKSFNEERFEDTLTMINTGYKKVSETQAKQTAVLLFYDTTSKTLKNFFIENWKIISILTAIVIIILIVFWRTLRIYIINSKMKHLQLQKATLNSLIKRIQKEYFTKKRISDTEFVIKLKKFKEMMLDIDRQMPLLREGLMKLNKRKV